MKLTLTQGKKKKELFVGINLEVDWEKRTIDVTSHFVSKQKKKKKKVSRKKIEFTKTDRGEDILE